MGVYHSATFGYGFYLSHDEYDDRHEGGLYEYAEEICSAAKGKLSSGSHISFAGIGNAYDGEYGLLIGFVRNVDDYEAVAVAPADVSEADKQYLIDLARSLELPEPGWYGGMYVY